MESKGCVVSVSFWILEDVPDSKRICKNNSNENHKINTFLNGHATF